MSECRALAVSAGHDDRFGQSEVPLFRRICISPMPTGGAPPDAKLVCGRPR
jgi:hypothetical protein